MRQQCCLRPCHKLLCYCGLVTQKKVFSCCGSYFIFYGELFDSRKNSVQHDSVILFFMLAFLNVCYFMSRVMRKSAFCIYAKTKTQISFAVTRIVHSLYFLNPRFHSSSHLLWLYSPVYVGSGRKSRSPVFSQRGSYLIILYIAFLFQGVPWEPPCSLLNNRYPKPEKYA